jgi:hypothetical protein
VNSLNNFVAGESQWFWMKLSVLVYGVHYLDADVDGKMLPMLFT